MGRRVYLHIGAPKTGTSYVQDRLRLNRAELARHGVHYPLGFLGLPSSHFKPALDLIEREWGGALAGARGAWPELAARVRRLDGTVVVSHEILAAANEEQVARARNDLAGSEVHIVYTARDLARQVPAAWQEAVKQYGTMSYRRFLKRVRRRSPDMWFWMVQELGDVLGRWGVDLPPEQIHLVTVPHPGAPPDLLWRRFCEVLGVDPAWATVESARGNTSMGSAETTMVRRLNQRLHKAGVTAPDHRALVTELLVHQNLAKRTGSPRTTLPPGMLGWADDVAGDWIEWAERTGVHVVGDLQELRPVRPADGASWRDPDKARPKLMLDAALDGVAVMLEEIGRRPGPDSGLGERLSTAVRAVRGE